MKINLSRIFVAVLSVFSAIVLAACTVPGGTTSRTGSTGPVANAGTVQMWVTDAPRSDNVSEIWVTVSEVKIHKAGSGNVSDNTSDNVTGNTSEGQEDTTPDNAADWITVNITGANRFDLLTLRGDGNGSGLQQILATANLAAGRYTQIRMSISEVEVNLNGVLKDATIPSGKLRFVHPFEIEAGNMTKLLFDFDADKFVNVTGSPKEPKIMVKPVVKLIVSKPQHPAESPEGAHDGVKITTTTLPNGSLDASYNATLAASGGTLPYTWSLQGGNLPGGLALSPAGDISGTANTTGNYSFVVKVSDNSTPVTIDTQHLTLAITGG